MSARAALRLAAAGMFGAAILFPPLSASIAALAGTGLLTVSVWDLDDSEVRPRTWRLLIAALALLVLWRGIDRGALSYPSPAGAMPVILLAGVLLMVGLSLAGRRRWNALVVVIGAVLFLGAALEVMWTFGGDPLGLDVYRSHVAAASAVRAGENPYTDAVSILDGSPNAAPGSTIDGYSYPPVTLVGYVGADLLLGDPRWISALAVVGVVAGLAVLGLDRVNVTGAALLVLLAVPLQRAMIWSGWTEPLTLALLVGGILLWRRELLSPVLLGLALASKQYLVVLAPLLVVLDSRPWRRSLLMLSTSFVTLIPAFVADFPAFWHAMVTRPLGLGFRPDTRSISGALAQLGVSFEVPSWLMLVVVTALGVWLARRAVTRADVFAAAAGVLAATFLLSLAFVNYWWLVQWMAAFAAVLTVAEDRSVAIRTDASASA